MTKKDFTNEVPKRLNDLSDIELIEELEKGSYGSGDVYESLIEAILNKRLKIVIQDLTKNVQRGNEATTKYNRALIILSFMMFFVSVMQVTFAVYGLSGTPIHRVGLITAFIVLVIVVPTMRTVVKDVHNW